MDEKITLQMIFDKAWQAFIVEDRPPAAEFDADEGRYICRYSTEDGRRCAVGLALPDSVVTALAGKMVSFGCLAHKYEHYRYIFDDSVTTLAEDLLTNFQSKLHDELQEKGVWKYSTYELKERYKDVAVAYGLTIPGE